MKRSVYVGLASFLLLMTSAPYAFADSVATATPSASASCSPVTPTSGIQQPTGSDAATFTLNKCTGLWENQYYTWSPATKLYTPKTPYAYACDTAVWKWTYHKWIYNASSGGYANVPLVTTQLPVGAAIESGSPSVCTAPLPPVVSSSNQSGSNGSSTIGNGSNTNNANITNSTGVTVTNQIDSNGTTGDASLLGNTAAGNVASGNATVTANVVNNVASSSTLSGNVVTFTANVNGDVHGDLVIDPNKIQPASNGSALTGTNNITVNSQTTGALTNNINLNAASGNASATSNTAAGNVTSGNAQAVADVINVLNSVIRSGKSFVGVININGSLHGNILMPQSFLDQLLATNAPHTNMTISAADSTTLGINNTVKSTATTGSATATGNTATGNVGTGNASTAVTIFNLTGSQIVGSNCLLVFVNVSGQWVGVIMNAPAGTTAAALGANATDTAINANAAVNTNNTITNNINTVATSGNAAAEQNTKTGQVMSGNANTVVNLLNLENSQLNLSGWFGVLFINVFGNWFGNFGVYVPPAPTITKTGASDTPMPNTAPDKPVFSFVKHEHAAMVPQISTPPITDTSFTSVSAKFANAAGQTLGASAHTLGQNLNATPAAVSKSNQLQVVGGLLVIFGLTTWGAERVISVRRSHQSTITIQ